MDDIPVTNQSFEKAGGLAVYPNLRIGKILVVETRYRKNEDIESGLALLVSCAKKQGFAAVFGVKWEPHYYSDLNDIPWYRVYGTAYRDINVGQNKNRQ